MPLTDEQRSDILFDNLLKKDCAVIALQAVTGWGLQRCMDLCQNVAGYTEEDGTPHDGLPRILEQEGWHVAQVPTEGRTAAVFAMDHDDDQTYLVYVHKHVMPLVCGDLHNGRGSWAAPVLRALRVWR
jgi:hypothetical protein